MQGEPLFQMSDEMYILLNDWKHPWKEKEEREMEAFIIADMLNFDSSSRCILRLRLIKKEGCLFKTRSGACIIKHYGSVLYGKMANLRNFLKISIIKKLP